MTEQTTEQQQPLRPETPADFQAMRARLDAQQRESIERASKISAMWGSQEAAAVRKVVQTDGNVDWREFVSHCGGIVKVVSLVDEQGDPDTERIIPLVDELFSKHAVQEFAGGMTMTRRPQNRPYRHRKPVPEPMFPGDRDAPEGAAERLLREEQEAAARPRTTHPR
jgi:hypothetical protein